MQLNIFTGVASTAVVCRRYCSKWSRCGGHFTSRAAVPCYSRARIQRGNCWATPLSPSREFYETDFVDRMFCLRVSSPLTYLLHGAESFLRSEPVNFAASQEIPLIYGTPKFLTVPTIARHLSLSWANSIPSPFHEKNYAGAPGFLC
jgi:hypothetical protein